MPITLTGKEERLRRRLLELDVQDRALEPRFKALQGTKQAIESERGEIISKLADAWQKAIKG
jgi:hypothetical protein